MSTINLLESAQGESSRRSGSNLGKTLIFPIAILVFVLLVLGGSKFFYSYLDKKKISIDSQNAEELKSLNGKNVDRVFDFDQRLKKANEETASNVNYNDYLKDLENSIVSGIQVNSFSYSSSKIKIDLLADNFQTIARQILSLKKSNYLKNLNISETSRNAEGKISFSLQN